MSFLSIKKYFIIFLSSLLLQILMVTHVYAAPKKTLIPHWKAFDAASKKVVNHSSWQTLLNKYVTTQSGINLFKYSQVSTADKAILKKYIKRLENTNPAKLNRHEQFAFWVNLYNSKTVDLILDNYPVTSIKRIGSILSGPWDKKYLNVHGRAVSLNNIEHGILRPIFNDERIHYAVNCASMGCPNLSKKAFTASNYQAHMSKLAKNFVNHRRAVHFEKGTLVLSSIYDWYAIDFGKSKSQQLKSIARYAKPALKSKLAAYKGDIKYQYDWSLNK